MNQIMSQETETECAHTQDNMNDCTYEYLRCFFYFYLVFKANNNTVLDDIPT